MVFIFLLCLVLILAHLQILVWDLCFIVKVSLFVGMKVIAVLGEMGESYFSLSLMKAYSFGSKGACTVLRLKAVAAVLLF